MTMDELEKRVQEIEAMKGDPEMAHSYEDSLYADFIRYVSTLPDQQLAIKAAIVLKTEKIDFARWCA